MKYYEITYTYEGKKGTAVVYEKKGWEERFYKNCLDRIDSLTRAGAVIVDSGMRTIK